MARLGFKDVKNGAIEKVNRILEVQYVLAVEGMKEAKLRKAENSRFEKIEAPTDEQKLDHEKTLKASVNRCVAMRQFAKGELYGDKETRGLYNLVVPSFDADGYNALVNDIKTSIMDTFGFDLSADKLAVKLAHKLAESICGKDRATASGVAKGELLKDRRNLEVVYVNQLAMFAQKTNDEIIVPDKDHYTTSVEFDENCKVISMSIVEVDVEA